MYRVLRIVFISLVLSSTSFATSTIGNFGQVTGLVYRGERLNDEPDYQELARLGVKTIINLESLFEDDQKICSKYGISCTRFPIPLRGFPELDKNFDYKMLEKAFQFLIDENSRNKKVYIHCHYGSDRTGALVSAVTIRLNYCENKENYNADAAWDKVQSDLRTYNYHDFLYKKLKKNIKLWTYTPPDWICTHPTQSE